MSEDLRKTIILFPRPTKIGGGTYTSVTMREPMVEDEIAVVAESETGTNQESEARLVARLCDLPADAVIKMKSGQYRVLQRPLLVFLSTPWTESDEPSSSSAGSADGGGQTSGG
ncbi:MAG: phage tail assembly protein [Magnetospirillum sp.]|nr:MAG: phage tail assembly protein [Magnetospirillum sp.]